MQRLFFVVFLCYPSVCKVVFSTFNCIAVTPEDATAARSVLVDDDRVMCEDADHQWIQQWSKLVIVIVAVGVPVFFGCWIAVKARRYGRQSQQAVGTPGTSTKNENTGLHTTNPFTAVANSNISLAQKAIDDSCELGTPIE